MRHPAASASVPLPGAPPLSPSPHISFPPSFGSYVLPHQACDTVFKDADDDFSSVAAVKRRLEEFKARLVELMTTRCCLLPESIPTDGPHGAGY